MQVLLTDIELDIQELKCLMDAFMREPNASLREVIRRNILQMRGRLDALLLNLDAVSPMSEHQEVKEAEAICLATDAIEPLAEPALPIVEGEQPAAAFVQPVDEKPEAAPVPILGERIKTAAELSRSISLNDSFRFSRELFGGDVEQMNRVLQQVGEMSTYAAALSFLTSKVKVSEENEAMADLLELLKKYFN